MTDHAHYTYGYKAAADAHGNLERTYFADGVGSVRFLRTGLLPKAELTCEGKGSLMLGFLDRLTMAAELARFPVSDVTAVGYQKLTGATNPIADYCSRVSTRR